ncbi:MAG: hypothetical protein QOF51_1612 [Chloroflexota bacterium]|jgi:phosphoglycerate dehydrogenase-like enzyme|nr:hypothetical protein [Chloroflexota bacterium]
MASGRDGQIVVVLPRVLPDDYFTAVQAVSPRVRVVPIGDDEPLPPVVADADVFYRSWAIRRATVEAVLNAATHLRWLHVPSAGVDVALSPQVMAGDFTITHMVGFYDEPVAEFALTLILAAAKRLPQFVLAQQEPRWAGVRSWDRIGEENNLPILLRGKTVGIVGFGGIGRALARQLQPLHVRVLGYRREPRPDRLAETVYGPGQLGELLGQSDFVVLALPLTADTDHMFNAELIAQMKPSAWLVNVARGRLIDDDALVNALRQQRIGGAALDAFAREPLAADHPYWSLPNVILTPHAAGAFAELAELDQASFIGQLRRFLAGRPLQGIVDRTRGY